MSRGLTRLLFIGPDHGSAVGGREQLSRLHRRALGDLLGDRIETFFLPRRALSGAAALLAVVSGRIDGTDRGTEELVLARIADRAIDTVWLDGSNLGVLAHTIKRQFPKINVVTFFHNVEARFFLGALRHKPGVRALAVLAANYTAERMAVRSSHRLITLTRRDGDLLKALYGRDATDLLPMAIEDHAALVGVGNGAVPEANFLLFVGGGFYANRAGILWFAREVAPNIDLQLCVVGRGLDDLRCELDATPNVRLVGAVDDLRPWYQHSKAVIAPIFDGSGMKTKVAEALMYGKPVIGTRESFAGYDDVAEQAGWRAETPADWIATIEGLTGKSRPAFDPSLRRLYVERYSRDAAMSRISAILEVG